MMDEEFEELSELSKKTLGSYIKHGSNNVVRRAGEARGAVAAGDHDRSNEQWKKIKKREQGINLAVDKLTKEEVEEVDLQELSKKTLGSYVRKASGDAVARAAVGTAAGAAKDHNTAGNQWKKIKTRTSGIDKAMNRLTKEKVLASIVNEDIHNFEDIIHTTLKEHAGVALDGLFEELDLQELSKKTLGSYVNKANLDNIDSAFRAGRYGSDTVDKVKKRNTGISKAVHKLTKESVLSALVNEDISDFAEIISASIKEHASYALTDLFEELDLHELSRKTLASYVGKAKDSEIDHNSKSDLAHVKSTNFMNNGDLEKADSGYAKSIAHGKVVDKRNTGIKKALARLAKEETELQELSNKTLGSYIRKSAKESGSLDKHIDKLRDAHHKFNFSIDGEEHLDRETKEKLGAAKDSARRDLAKKIDKLEDKKQNRFIGQGRAVKKLGERD
jgi:chorismate-pyruvate lyase